MPPCANNRLKINNKLKINGNRRKDDGHRRKMIRNRGKINGNRWKMKGKRLKMKGSKSLEGFFHKTAWDTKAKSETLDYELSTVTFFCPESLLSSRCQAEAHLPHPHHLLHCFHLHNSEKLNGVSK